jgi:hypothetical protein
MRTVLLLVVTIALGEGVAAAAPGPCLPLALYSFDAYSNGGWSASISTAAA